MTIEPRQNNARPDEIQAKVGEMQKSGWKEVATHWDEDLKVWRATATRRGAKREGRGSTELHALAALTTVP